MIPRCKIGKGVSGALRYALSEGKDPLTGRPRTEPKGDHSRIAWIGGTGFGFPIQSRDDADLARRMMEFTALNQTSATRLCEKDCVHLSLGWRQGEKPTRSQMEQAAHGALAALGMPNARAVFVAHRDETYHHLHIVASKIDPLTGRAYDMKGNFLKLSQWAEAYERDFSGGIVCSRRAEANQMREAISRRDAAAVIELLTQRRATFKGKDLDRVLAKQIRSLAGRSAFAQAILRRPEIVRLADIAGGPVSRFTTRSVLAAERQVLEAAAGLVADNRHSVGIRHLKSVIGQRAYAGLSTEQVAAVRHATDERGLALIDGQAGTGKSFTIDVIRHAYERAGCQVTGLAPTNAVAQDMEASGFRHTATLHSELFRLNSGRASWKDRSVIILDEAAMVDTKMMAQLVGHARRAGAKLIMVGDDRQLSSIDRGGMFGVLKDRYGAAELSQVRRQTKNDDRRAAELMAEGNFHTALGMYDAKGAIHWTATQERAAGALITQWARDSAVAPGKSRFIFAYTNTDVDQLNAGIRAVRKGRGELRGPDHSFTTRHGVAPFAIEDRIQITGTDKARGLVNGAAGTIEAIHGSRISVTLDGRQPQRVTFDAEDFMDFRHGYAGTIYKGQGRTLDQTYLFHSSHWRSAPSYVALTRHRDSVALFVARETAGDVKQLARQMARVDDRRAASHFHVVDGMSEFPTHGEILTVSKVSQQSVDHAFSDTAHDRRGFTSNGPAVTRWRRMGSVPPLVRIGSPPQIFPLAAAMVSERPHPVQDPRGIGRGVAAALDRSADDPLPAEHDDSLSFQGEMTMLHQMYGARIEATRRSVTGKARADAIRALKQEQKAAAAALTERHRQVKRGRRASMQKWAELRKARRLVRD